MKKIKKTSKIKHPIREAAKKIEAAKKQYLKTIAGMDKKNNEEIDKLFINSLQKIKKGERTMSVPYQRNSVYLRAKGGEDKRVMGGEDKSDATEIFVRLKNSLPIFRRYYEKPNINEGEYIEKNYNSFTDWYVDTNFTNTFRKRRIRGIKKLLELQLDLARKNNRIFESINLWFHLKKLRILENKLNNIINGKGKEKK